MKPECVTLGKPENYRFFLGFLMGGATNGLLLKAIMSCMTLYATWMVSPLRFLAGLIMPPDYHARAGRRKRKFKVAHYPMLTMVAIY
jgi:hypothetical protein